MEIYPLDLGSKWCLSKITQNLRALLAKIHHFEQMTVHEVFSQDGKIGKAMNRPG